MQDSEIAIVSNSLSFELIEKTIKTFPTEVHKYVIDGALGMHGLQSIMHMLKKFRKKKYRWIVLVDEDAVFIDPNCVHEIVAHMKKEGLTVAGVRDGGVIKHRRQNPFVVNTFFVFLDLDNIRDIINIKSILKNQYLTFGEFDDDIGSLSFEYDKTSLFEPYYCFFLFLRRNNHKFYFFDSRTHVDGISNIVYFKNKPVLLHTWYAREYHVGGAQSDRIEQAINEYCNDDQEVPAYTVLKTRFASFLLRVNHLHQGLVGRISELFDRSD